MALSPLVDDRFVKALQDLVVRGFPVVLLAISPVDVTRAVLAPSLPTDITCRLWALERVVQLQELRQQGIVVLEWHPDEPLELVLSGMPQRRRIRRVAP